MKTYNQFREEISNLLNFGWNTGDTVLPEYEEIIKYLEYEKNNLSDNPSEIFMEQFKIKMNIASSYCFYILFNVENLDKDNSPSILRESRNIHYCIGDLTSLIPSTQEIKNLFVFSPHQSTVIIAKALILLSNLPFENDENRKQFNKLVIYYQDKLNDKTTLKEVQLENPGSCYIATMAYGDYNHPQVIILRDYRDRKLMPNFFGRLFVKFYYLISPYLVNLLKDFKSINRIIRIILNLWIKRIKKMIS